MKATAAGPADQYQDALGLICRWFDARSMPPFDFQRKAWDAYLAGQNGLIHAPTGIGKTYAAWFGPLIEWMTGHHRKRPLDGIDNRRARDESPRIRVLGATPLRALSAALSSLATMPRQPTRVLATRSPGTCTRPFLSRERGTREKPSPVSASGKRGGCCRPSEASPAVRQSDQNCG